MQPSNREENAQVSFVSRLFASVMDYPLWCLALLILLTGLAIGGYLDPDWPQKLQSRFIAQETKSDQATASGPTPAATNVNAQSNARGDNSTPRRFRRRGGFGGAGRAEAVLVIKSPAIFTPEGSQAFRAVYHAVGSLDYHAVGNLDMVASVRSLDQAPPLNIFGLNEPILPRANATQQRFDVAKKKAISHPMVVGQMLSEDAQTALMEIQYDWVFIQQNSDCSEPILKAAKLAASEFPNVPMEFQITGSVPLRLVLQQNNRSNEIRYQVIGYSMILLMAIILFRGLSVVLAVAAAPMLGVFWTLGFLRYFDLQENPFSFVILPVLLSLVGFTDGVHMMIHIRKCMREGMPARDACKRTLELVGLACFLTSMTTAIGMGSLAWANHEVVQEFGWACVLGVTATWISVMLVIPLLSMTPWSKRFTKGSERDLLHHVAVRFDPTIRKIIKHKVPVSIFAIALTIILGFVTSALRPDDRKSTAFPTGSDAQQSLAHLDQALGGLDVCTIDLQWNPEELDTSRVVQAISEAEELLRQEKLIGHPLSLVTLLNALPGEGSAIDKVSMAELLPPPLRQRLFDDIADIAAKNPSLKMDMQGEAIWRWRNLYTMVTDLINSLGSAALIIFAVLAIAYGSLRIGLIAIIPNILPLLASATYMVFTKQPLEVVSVCCFTICLGIAVDDTIHFLSRYLEEFKNGGSQSEVIERSFKEVGTGMMMTTIVLVAGFSSVLTSDTRDHRVFGALGAITLVSALLCDMFLLPALLAAFDRKRTTHAG